LLFIRRNGAEKKQTSAAIRFVDGPGNGSGELAISEVVIVGFI